MLGDIMGDNDKRETSQSKHPLLSCYGSSWSPHCGGNQVGQAWFPLSESLLAPPEYTSCFEVNMWGERKKKVISNGRPLEMQTLTGAAEEPQHNPAATRS